MAYGILMTVSQERLEALFEAALRTVHGPLQKLVEETSGSKFPQAPSRAQEEAQAELQVELEEKSEV